MEITQQDLKEAIKIANKKAIKPYPDRPYRVNFEDLTTKQILALRRAGWMQSAEHNHIYAPDDWVPSRK